jgi:hypothetical protein
VPVRVRTYPGMWDVALVGAYGYRRYECGRFRHVTCSGCRVRALSGGRMFGRGRSWPNRILVPAARTAPDSAAERSHRSSELGCFLYSSSKTLKGSDFTSWSGTSLGRCGCTPSSRQSSGHWCGSDLVSCVATDAAKSAVKSDGDDVNELADLAPSELLRADRRIPSNHCCGAGWQLWRGSGRLVCGGPHLLTT